jgi:dipeptide/tripeptide permease
MVAGSILLVIGAQLSSPFAVGTTLAIAFGLVSSTDGSFWSATIEAGGDDVGAACGILNTGSNIGGFVAPVFTPMIAAVAGWSAALYFACFVVTTASMIWFLMKPRMAQ